MERDPILQAIDDEYVEATAEALRLGRRPRLARQTPVGERPSLLTRLQQPERLGERQQAIEKLAKR